MTSDRLNVLAIEKGTTVDGPGFRTSIYIAGCKHGCKGCHNPQSWDFMAGQPMTIDEIIDVVREEDFDVTLSGGDPFCSADKVIPLARKIRSAGYGLWIFTGFTWEEIAENEQLLALAKEADVVVDGPFIEALRDPDLLFKGSSNQRIIDIKASLENGFATIWHR